MKIILFLCFLLAGLSGCAAEPQTSQYDVPVIALLDTGVSTTAIPSESLLPGWNYVLDSDDTEDRLNHGTAVTSVILGCDSAGVEGLAEGNCLVVPLVVADESGSIPPETLAQAICDSVDTYGANIINISLGIKKDVPEVREAVAYAEEQGALVVSAVGNEGESEDLDKRGKVSDFSQKNGTAEILAPGEDIWLASKNGNTYGARGTSYATAFASAAAANILAADPSLTPAQVRELLYAAAVDIEKPGYDADSGWGMLDPETAL